MAKFKILEMAQRLIRSGVSLVPCRPSKRPYTELLPMESDGRRSWKAYQTRIASDSEVSAWFGPAQHLATVCGKVSGGLETLDFDDADGCCFEQWRALVASENAELFERLVINTTPSGGYHCRYRYDAEHYQGNQKLAARWVSEGGNRVSRTLIETRCEGGYALCYPSKGYDIVQGNLADLPLITREQREFLLLSARSFHTAVDDHIAEHQSQHASRPGDIYNQCDDWKDVLTGHDWEQVRTCDDVEYWRRPGTKSPWSASWNYIPGRFYVFSTNAHPFQEMQAYTPFGVYALLEHEGDFSKAARKLAGRQSLKAEANPRTSEPQGDDTQAQQSHEIITMVPDNDRSCPKRDVYEDGNQYVKRSRNKLGEEQHTPISTFVIQPRMRIWVDGFENIRADIITQTATARDVVIYRKDWNAKDRFMNTLPSVDHVWYGTATDIQSVQSIVSSYSIPARQGTTKLGWHPDIWLLPSGGISTTGWINEPELVYLPLGGRGELDNKIRYEHLGRESYQKLLTDVYTYLPQLNQAHVMIPVIGWFFATPFKPQLDSRYGGFPFLSIYGTRGAGKSTLLRLMWRLFGFSGGQTSKLFSCTETDFVMLKLLSATTSIPVCLDEYKPCDMPLTRLRLLHRILRRCYNGEIEFRGRADQTTTEYSLTAPVAIAGEVALAESALLERMIPVEMSPNHLTGTREAFSKLWQQQLQGFCDRYIQFSMQTDFTAEIEQVEHTTRELLGHSIPDRICNNLTVMLFGWHQFRRYGVQAGILDPQDAGLETITADVLGHTVRLLCGDEGRSRTALDYLVAALAVMAETGRLVPRRDYVVREDQNQVAIRFDSCLAEFRKYVRDTQFDVEVLSGQAYRQQIKENHDREGYIASTSAPVLFGTTQKRAVVLDRSKAEAETSMDLEGFYAYLEG